MSTSLYQKFPHRKDVILLLLTTTLLLTAGLSLPIMSVKQLLLWKESFSIWQGIGALIDDRAYILAAIIFFFSILFPYLKIGGLGYIWFAKVKQDERQITMRWLKVLAKWSMLDVFVVAILIVMNKTGGPINVSPRIGLYCFAAAIILSILVSMLIDRILKQKQA